MSPTKQLETTEQVVAALGDLRRMKILEILTERQASVKELALVLQESPQTTNYHTKLLERAGLIEIVEKREVRGTLEKFYRAVADRFIVGDIIGKASSEFGWGLVQNFLELARYGEEETDGKGLTIYALGIQTDPARAEEFRTRLDALVQEFQGLNTNEGARYAMVATMFPIPQDVVLPDHPNAIFEVIKDEIRPSQITFADEEGTEQQ